MKSFDDRAETDRLEFILLMISRYLFVPVEHFQPHYISKGKST